MGTQCLASWTSVQPHFHLEKQLPTTTEKGMRTWVIPNCALSPVLDGLPFPQTSLCWLHLLYMVSGEGAGNGPPEGEGFRREGCHKPRDDL